METSVADFLARGDVDDGESITSPSSASDSSEPSPAAVGASASSDPSHKVRPWLRVKAEHSSAGDFQISKAGLRSESVESRIDHLLSLHTHEANEQGDEATAAHTHPPNRVVLFALSRTVRVPSLLPLPPSTFSQRFGAAEGYCRRRFSRCSARLLGSSGNAHSDGDLVPLHTNAAFVHSVAPNNRFVALATPRCIQLHTVDSCKEKNVPPMLRGTVVSVSLDHVRATVGTSLLRAQANSQSDNEKKQDVGDAVSAITAELAAVTQSDGSQPAPGARLVTTWDDSSQIFALATGSMIYLIDMRQSVSGRIATRMILLPAKTVVVGMEVLEYTAEAGDKNVRVAVCTQSQRLGIVELFPIQFKADRGVQALHFEYAHAPNDSSAATTTQLTAQWKVFKFPKTGLYRFDQCAFFVDAKGSCSVAVGGRRAKPSASEKNRGTLSSVHIFTVQGLDRGGGSPPQFDSRDVLNFTSSSESLSQMAQRRNAGICTSILSKCSRRWRRRRAGAPALVSLSFSACGGFVAASDMFGDLNVWGLQRQNREVQAPNILHSYRVIGHFWTQEARLCLLRVPKLQQYPSSSAAIEIIHFESSSGEHFDESACLVDMQVPTGNTRAICQRLSSDIPIDSTLHVSNAPNGLIAFATTQNDRRRDNELLLSASVRLFQETTLEQVVDTAQRTAQFAIPLHLSQKFSLGRDTVLKGIIRALVSELVFVENQFCRMRGNHQVQVSLDLNSSVVRDYHNSTPSQQSVDVEGTSATAGRAFEDEVNARYLHFHLLASISHWLPQVQDQEWVGTLLQLETSTTFEELSQGLVSTLSIDRMQHFLQQPMSTYDNATVSRYCKLLWVLGRTSEALDSAEAKDSHLPTLPIAKLFSMKNSPAIAWANVLVSPRAAKAVDFIALEALFEAFPSELFPMRLRILRRLIPLAADPTTYAHLLPALPRDSTELQESVTRASREANELSSDGEAVSSQHNLYFWRCGTHRSHSWLAIANCYELSLEDITRLKNNSLGSDVSLLCAESFDILSRWYQARIRAIDSATGLLGHCLSQKIICEHNLALRNRPRESAKELRALLANVQTLSVLVFSGSAPATMRLVTWEQMSLAQKLQCVTEYHLMDRKPSGGGLCSKLRTLRRHLISFCPTPWSTLLRTTIVAQHGTTDAGATITSPIKTLLELLTSNDTVADDLAELFGCEQDLLQICIDAIYSDTARQDSWAWDDIRQIIDAATTVLAVLRSRGSGASEKPTSTALLTLNARMEECRVKWVPAGVLMSSYGFAVSPKDLQEARSIDLADRSAGDVSTSRKSKSGIELLSEFIQHASLTVSASAMDSDWESLVEDCIEVHDLAFYWIPKKSWKLCLGSSMLTHGEKLHWHDVPLVLGKQLLSHNQLDLAWQLLRPAGQTSFAVNDDEVAAAITDVAAEFFNAAPSLYPLRNGQQPDSSTKRDDPLALSMQYLSMCPRTTDVCNSLFIKENMLVEAAFLLRQLRVLDHVPAQIRLRKAATDIVTWIFDSHRDSCILHPKFFIEDGDATDSSDDAVEAEMEWTSDGAGATALVEHDIRVGHPSVKLLQYLGVTQEHVYVETWVALALHAFTHWCRAACDECLHRLVDTMLLKLGPWIMNAKVDHDAPSTLHFALQDLLAVLWFIACTPNRTSEQNVCPTAPTVHSSLAPSAQLKCLQLGLQLLGVHDAGSLDSPSLWWRSVIDHEFFQDLLSAQPQPSFTEFMNRFNALERTIAMSWEAQDIDDVRGDSKELRLPSEVVVRAATKAIAATASAVSKATTSYIEKGGLIGFLASRYSDHVSHSPEPPEGDMVQQPEKTESHNVAVVKPPLLTVLLDDPEVHACGRNFLQAASAFLYDVSGLEAAHPKIHAVFNQRSFVGDSLSWHRMTDANMKQTQDDFVRIQNPVAWETLKVAQRLAPSYFQFYSWARHTLYTHSNDTVGKVSAQNAVWSKDRRIAFIGLLLSGLVGSPMPPMSQKVPEGGPFQVTDMTFLVFIVAAFVAQCIACHNNGSENLRDLIAETESWLTALLLPSLGVGGNTGAIHSANFLPKLKSSALYDRMLRFRWLVLEASKVCCLHSPADLSQANEAAGINAWARGQWKRVQFQNIDNFFVICDAANIQFATLQQQVEAAFARDSQVVAVCHSAIHHIRSAKADASGSESLPRVLTRLQSRLLEEFSFSEIELQKVLRAVLLELLNQISSHVPEPEDWDLLDSELARVCHVFADPAQAPAADSIPEGLASLSQVAFFISTFTHFVCSCIAQGHARRSDNLVDILGTIGDLFIRSELKDEVLGTHHMALAILCALKSTALRHSTPVPKEEQHAAAEISALEMHRRLLRNVANLDWTLRVTKEPSGAIVLDYKEATGEAEGHDFFTDTVDPSLIHALMESFRGAVVAVATPKSLVAYAALVGKYHVNLKQLCSANAAADDATNTYSAGVDTKVVRLFVVMTLTDREIATWDVLRNIMNVEHGESHDCQIADNLSELLLLPTVLAPSTQCLLPSHIEQLHDLVHEIAYDSYQLLFDDVVSSAGDTGQSDGLSWPQSTIHFDHVWRLMLGTAISNRQAIVADAVCRVEQLASKHARVPLTTRQKLFQTQKFLACAQQLLTLQACPTQLVQKLLLTSQWADQRAVLVSLLMNMWKSAADNYTRCNEEMESEAAPLCVSEVAKLVFITRSSSSVPGTAPLSSVNLRSEISSMVVEAVNHFATFCSTFSEATSSDDVESVLQVIFRDLSLWEKGIGAASIANSPETESGVGQSTASVLQFLRSFVDQNAPHALFKEAFFAVLEKRGLNTPAEHLQFLRSRALNIVQQYWKSFSQQHVTSPSKSNSEPLQRDSSSVLSWPASDNADVRLDKKVFGEMIVHSTTLDQYDALKQLLLLFLNTGENNNAKKETVRTLWRQLLLQMSKMSNELREELGPFSAAPSSQLNELLHSVDCTEISQSLSDGKTSTDATDSISRFLATSLWEVLCIDENNVSAGRNRLLQSAVARQLVGITSLAAIPPDAHGGALPLVSWWRSSRFCYRLLDGIDVSTLIEWMTVSDRTVSLDHVYCQLAKYCRNSKANNGSGAASRATAEDVVLALHKAGLKTAAAQALNVVSDSHTYFARLPYIMSRLNSFLSDHGF